MFLGAEPIHVMSNLDFGFSLWFYDILAMKAFFHINVNVCLEGFMKQIIAHLLGENWIYFWIKQTEILDKKYPCFDMSQKKSQASVKNTISHLIGH